MEAVAHNPSFAQKAGVPQSVGKDFAKADDVAGITTSHHDKVKHVITHTQVHGHIHGHNTEQ